MDSIEFLIEFSMDCPALFFYTNLKTESANGQLDSIECITDEIPFDFSVGPHYNGNSPSEYLLTHNPSKRVANGGILFRSENPTENDFSDGNMCFFYPKFYWNRDAFSTV